MRKGLLLLMLALCIVRFIETDTHRYTLCEEIPKQLGKPSHILIDDVVYEVMTVKEAKTRYERGII